MKKAISILLLPILFGGLVSCTKSDSAPSISQPSFVIDGNTINLNGISTAHLYSTGDSLIVINSNTTDSAAFDNIQIGNTTSINYSVILIGSNNSLRVGTYTTSQSNLSMLVLGLQYQNLYYTGGKVPSASTPGICYSKYYQPLR